jgi:hypothetical protein
MKEFKQGEWSQVAKYITNEASYEERLWVEYLLKENEKMKTIFERLRNFYENRETPGKLDSVAAFKKLDARIKK